MLKNLMVILLSSMVTLLGLEVAIRYFHSTKHHMTFWYDIEEEIYRSFSPIKKNFDEKKNNILLLGGSVLDDVAPQLILELEKNRENQVFSVATAAHSSRDSMLKYAYLVNQGFHFDQVLFYHGINEARANNIPPERFKEDYSHYFFYSQINPAFDESNKLLKFLLRSSIMIKAYQSFFYYLFKDDQSRFVPAHNPRPEWIQFGAEAKSVVSFKKNLQTIIELSKKTGGKLYVPHFALYLPLDYRAINKDHKNLGYAKKEDAKYFLTADVWGNPHHVKKTVLAHNEIIDTLSNQFHYIDTKILEKNGLNFVDPCHFSKIGAKEFIMLLLARIIQ